MSLGFLLTSARPATIEPVPLVIGALCFSFAYFTDAVESQTVALVLPAAREGR